MPDKARDRETTTAYPVSNAWLFRPGERQSTKEAPKRHDVSHFFLPTFPFRSVEDGMRASLLPSHGAGQTDDERELCTCTTPRTFAPLTLLPPPTTRLRRRPHVKAFTRHWKKLRPFEVSACASSEKAVHWRRYSLSAHTHELFVASSWLHEVSSRRTFFATTTTKIYTNDDHHI